MLMLGDKICCVVLNSHQIATSHWAKLQGWRSRLGLKVPHMYKTSLICIKINRNCINLPQMYEDRPHWYKQGTNKCINEIDHN